MYRNRYSMKGIWSGGAKDSASNICSMGYNALGRALKVSQPRRTQIPKIKGDEPKTTMEMRKEGLQQRSDWPESESKAKKAFLDGVWGTVSSCSVTIIIFCLDFNPLFAIQTLETG